MRVQCGKIDRCGIVNEFIDYNEHKFKITRKSIYHDGKTWGNISHASFCYIVSGVYDEIVHYRRNIFNVPSGRTGKSFIEEFTFWIKQINADSDLNSVALKAFMVLPTLILQKPSATSKSEEHSAAIELD